MSKWPGREHFRENQIFSPRYSTITPKLDLSDPATLAGNASLQYSVSPTVNADQADLIITTVHPLLPLSRLSSHEQMGI